MDIFKNGFTNVLNFAFTNVVYLVRKLNVIGNAWTTSQHQTDRQEIDNENSLKRHFMTIHFKETIKPINLKEC